MSMDFERRDSEKPITEQEGVMFAAQPVWERRGRKRGAFGRRAAPAAPMTSSVAPEPRSFAAEREYDEPMALDTRVDSPRRIPEERFGDDYVRADYAPGAASTMTPASSLDSDADGGLVAPIGATIRTDRGRRSNGLAPAAIAAGVVTLGAMGAVGWLASRDNDDIPEMAPGQATTTEMAAAPLPPVDAAPSVPPVADMAVNPPPAAIAPPRQTVRAAPVRTAEAARTRPAAATPSATETGVNSSATLPAGPQAYSTLNPGAAAPAPVNPATTAVTPSATEAAPGPAESPAAIPETPPTQATLPTDPAPENPATPPTT